MNPKSKGSNFEREVSRALSVWVTGSDENLVFWRTSGSGSVSTNMKKSGKTAKGLDGDIMCIESNSPYSELLDIFFIDSKCLGNVHLVMINPNNQKSNQILSEIVKVFGDAQSSKKIPMLICKATNDRRIPDFIILPNYAKFNYHNKMEYKIKLGEVDYNFNLVLQDEFFKMNDWKSFIQSNKILSD